MSVFIEREGLSTHLARWVAKNTPQSAVLGYIEYLEIFPDCELHDLFVYPEYRRQGVGQALLDHLFAKARQAGCKRVYLEVRVGNDAAIRLYARNGFEEYGRRPGYYPDTKEDAILLAKMI